MQPTTPSVLVVGAGPAGLATARALRDQGLAYDHVESHTGVGGLWDIDAPGTPMYESAHFISSRSVSGFPGFPMPESYPDYPSHRLILAYLRAFAERYDLSRHIRFGVTVDDLRRTEDEWWEVELRSADGESGPRRYRDVVFCTGPMNTPFVPPLPGDFDGEIMHSSSYRDPSQFRGRRVLVVGAGNSGCDIACDAARSADHAHLSMRRGYWILPKHLFGKPVDTLDQMGPRLPRRVQQVMLQRWIRIADGDTTRLGLPEPDHRVFETHPIVNSDLLTRLRHGDLDIRPGISEVDGGTVTFTDGSSVDVDLICMCTGYRHTIPAAGEYVVDDVMPDLYLQTFSREHDGLSAVGFLETNTGAYGHFDSCARMVAGHIADRDRDPAAYRRFESRMADRPDLSGGIRFDRSPRHTGYVDSHAFGHAVGAVLRDFGWHRGDSTSARQRNP